MFVEKYKLAFDRLDAGSTKFQDRLNQGTMYPHQFYNTNMGPAEYNWLRLLDQNEFEDNRGKMLNKTYYDIETYVKLDETKTPFNAKYAYYPVNSIAAYNNIENTCYIFVWLHEEYHEEFNQENLLKGVKDLYAESCQKNDKYIIDDLKIEIKIHRDEVALLIDFFTTVRNLNTHILMGFNSDNFDDPYVIKRLKAARPHDWEAIISEFAQVKSFGELSFEFPDYNMVDLLVLYKPVDNGGKGMGKSLPNFTLNMIANTELKLTKLDMDHDFVEAYEEHIIEYLTYNMLDTLLTYKLDVKLGFIEQSFALSRVNNAPLGSALRGRSLMFSYRNNKHFTDQNQLIRHSKFGGDVFFPMKKDLR